VGFEPTASGSVSMYSQAAFAGQIVVHAFAGTTMIQSASTRIGREILLYHLSYSPDTVIFMELVGLEPTTRG
jgi:hypothetical protein